MNVRHPLVLLAACTALPASLHAQAPELTPPPPVPPLVLETPPSSTYSISIKYSDEREVSRDTGSQPGTKSPLRSDRPVSVQVWRDTKSRRIVVQHADGMKSEGYLFDSGFVIRSTASSQKTFVAGSIQGRDASLDVFTKDFQGTQWLDMRYYVGVETVDGQKVYSFRQAPNDAPPPVTSGGDAPPTNYRPLDYMELTALIRVTDKMPVVVRLGSAKYTFSPPQPWDGVITVPDNFRASAESFSKEISVIEAFRKKNK